MIFCDYHRIVQFILSGNIIACLNYFYITGIKINTLYFMVSFHEENKVFVIVCLLSFFLYILILLDCHILVLKFYHTDSEFSCDPQWLAPTADCKTPVVYYPLTMDILHGMKAYQEF